MNDERFDAMVRQLGEVRSRRSALRIFCGAAAGMATVALFGSGRAQAVLCSWGQTCCAGPNLLTDVIDCLSGGGTCVDLQTDATNCGLCGLSCNGGTCGGGTCGQASSPTTTQTPATTQPPTTTQPPATSQPPTTTQPTAQNCSGGKTYCPGSGCVDLSSDLKNCGQCGQICDDGATCGSIAGLPGYTCLTKCAEAGLDYCVSYCADLATDPKNCGHCGVVCPGDGATCCDAVCCAPGKTCCGGYLCVDLHSGDPNNCGSCFTHCDTCDDNDTCCHGNGCGGPFGW